MKNFKLFLLALVLIPLLDYVWLGLIMKDFYLAELGSLVRLENGSLQPLIGPAFMVYVALALGTVTFVLPRTEGKPNKAFVFGALFGFCVYAVYDFTNLSLLQNWPVKMSLLDIFWGCLICGISAFVVQIVSTRFLTAR